MTDEQKFRLLEWMKGVTMAIEAMMPATGDIIRDEVNRFEQSLESESPQTLPPGDKRDCYGNVK